MANPTVKHPLASKTIWVNGIMGLLGFLLAFKPELSGVFNEGNIILFMGVVNIVLRAVTKDKLSIE